MLTSQRRVFRKFWHAVVPRSTLRDRQPVPFTLLGEPIVLFLDAAGQLAAFKDRCCHRTARLSKGRCDGGVLECGCHGWRFETWATSPLRALENSCNNAHFSFVHRATFGEAAQPRPSRYEAVERESGFYAETLIDAVNPPAFHTVSGTTEPVTTRLMRDAYALPFSRRLEIEYPSGVRHVIINCFTPIDDRRMQLVPWLFRNDIEADCPEAMLVVFDRQITAEDREMLEATDPDEPVDTRRRGVEFSMDSDRPDVLVRKQLMELLARHGEQEIHAGA